MNADYEIDIDNQTGMYLLKIDGDPVAYAAYYLEAEETALELLRSLAAWGEGWDYAAQWDADVLAQRAVCNVVCRVCGGNWHVGECSCEPPPAGEPATEPPVTGEYEMEW